MNYTKSQLELKKSFLSFVLYPSYHIFKELDIFLERNLDSSEENFEKQLNITFEIIKKELKKLDLRDIQISNITKEETIEICKNILPVCNQTDFKTIFIDNIDYELFEFNFGFYYIENNITIDYSNPNKIVLSLNYSDENLLNIINNYLLFLEYEFKKDLARNDIKDELSIEPTYNKLNEEDFNKEVELQLLITCRVHKLIATQENIQITKEKIDTSINKLLNLEYSKSLDDSKFNHLKKQVKSYSNKELKENQKKRISTNPKDIATCDNCLEKDIFFAVKREVKNKTYMYRFCHYCDSIYLYEKGFFGMKKKPLMKSSLSMLAGFANMIRDIGYEESYKFTLTKRALIPPVMVDDFFNGGFLIIDDFGLRTRTYEYFNVEKFYCFGAYEESKKDKIKERQKRKQKNMQEADRIKNGQLLDNENCWIEMVN